MVGLSPTPLVEAQPGDRLHQVRTEKLLQRVAGAMLEQPPERLLHHVLGQSTVAEHGGGEPHCTRPLAPGQSGELLRRHRPGGPSRGRPIHRGVLVHATTPHDPRVLRRRSRFTAHPGPTPAYIKSRTPGSLSTIHRSPSSVSTAELTVSLGQRQFAVGPMPQLP